MNYLLISCLLILLNCNNFYSSQYVRTNLKTKSSLQNVTILIRNYKLNEKSSFVKLQLLEITGRKNIKDAIVESGLFQKVLFFNKKLVTEDSMIIDLQIDEIESKIVPNDNLNPIAILTFGLIGGSIQDLKNSFRLKLMVYNSRNELLKEKYFQFSESIEMDYDEVKAFTKMSELRSKFIMCSIDEVLQ